MKCLAFLLMCLAIGTTTVNAAYCNMKSNVTGPMNMIPIDLSAPVFVTSVPNGELYTVGGADDQIHLMHLYGNNGYDFGYAAGQLMGPQMTSVLSSAWSYFLVQVMEEINGTTSKYGISQAMTEEIANFGLEAALDTLYEVSKQFIDPEIFAEMHGMADATGLDYKMIRRIHFIGDLTRGSCSLYGTWGKATLNAKTLQLRALDWDLHAGLQNHPTVTIYHPLNPSMGYAFANVGWAGWIGTLTGMSSNKLGISEIGISYPDSSFGDESYVGLPFIFLERKILQFGTSVWNALDMISNANRTCRLLLGVGDGNAATAREVQYSHSKVRFFNDTDLEPNTWWHPRINDMVYDGMDWICPYYQHVLYKQLSYLHGQLTPENSIMNVTSVVQTGDLHAAVYDLTDVQLYVANARRASVATGSPYAYGRQFHKLDAKTLFVKQFGEGH